MLTLPLIHIINSALAILDGEQVKMLEEIAPNASAITSWRGLITQCANKGTCERKSGQCQCFVGYEGKACGRQSCPSDCSGHGTCEYVST